MSGTDWHFPGSHWNAPGRHWHPPAIDWRAPDTPPTRDAIERRERVSEILCVGHSMRSRYAAQTETQTDSHP